MMRASVEHGPGWDTERGRRVSEYLRAEADAIGLLLDASAEVPWLVVVTGEAAAVRAFGNAPPPAAGAENYETGVMRPEDAFAALAACQGEAYADGARAAHARGDKRSVLVCLAGEVIFAQVLVETVSAEAFARRGGGA